MAQRYEYIRQPVFVSLTEHDHDSSAPGYEPDAEKTMMSLKEAMDELPRQGWRAIAFIPIAGGRARVGWQWKDSGTSAYAYGWGYGCSPTTLVMIIWETP